MFRVGIFVVAIVGIFAGTLVYGGKQVGAWDDADPPPPSNQAPITRPEEKKKGGSASAVAGGGAPTQKLSPEKARWVRQANALCRRAYEDMTDYEEPETLGEAEKVIAELQRKNERYNDAFAAIRPVKEDAREVGALLALFDKDERLVAALLTAMRQGDAGALLELNDRLTAVAEQESDILVGLGATDCQLAFAAPSY